MSAEGTVKNIPESETRPSPAVNPNTICMRNLAVTNRPDLSETQQGLLLQTTALHVAQHVLGHPVGQTEELPAELENLPVWGVFVSLKNGRELRACCGQLGDELTLGRGLLAAAERAAKWDLRFRTIQPAELAQLHCEVWLLWNQQRVEAKGRDRLNAIQIGRHGLQIAKGDRRGLLLPAVAVENHWDTEQFLRGVCRKAGLPLDAWMDDDTELFTFEGHAITAPLANFLPPEILERQIPGPGLGDVARLAEFARQNLLALLQGATPSFYTNAAFDGAVQGLVVTLKFPTKDGRWAKLMEASRVFPQGSLPLQATLMDLLQTILAGIRGQRMEPGQLQPVQIGLTVLLEPRLLGNGTESALDMVDPRQQALCVTCGDRWVLRYRPAEEPSASLESLLSRLHTPSPVQAQVFALRVLTTEDELEVSNVPRPVTGPAIRPPAVAGQFYPADANQIDDFLQQHLPPPDQRQERSGAIVPHAGWGFSGRLSAEVWGRIQIPSQVIIVGPKHRPMGCDWAVAPYQTWSLPGLSLKSDLQLAQAIAEGVPFMELDATAHSMEWAIEVQLPILARLAPAAKVVGIVMRGGQYDGLRTAARQFAKLLQALPVLPLLVVSSDMNHYADDDTTRRVDAFAIEAIRACDPEGLWNAVREHRISMCGVLPAVFVMETLRNLGRLTRAEIVGYTTSAETSGDRSRVVGYLGAVFA